MRIRSDLLINNSSTSFVIGFKAKNVKRELKDKKYTMLPDYDLLVQNCKNHLHRTDEYTKPLNAKTEEEYYYAENPIDREFLIVAFDELNTRSNVYFLEDERNINQLADLIKDNEMRAGMKIKSEKEYIIMARKYKWEAIRVDPKERIELATKMKEIFIRKMNPYPYMSYFSLSSYATPLEQVLRDSKYVEAWFPH